jgi:hypothetical protein
MRQKTLITFAQDLVMHHYASCVEDPAWRSFESDFDYKVVKAGTWEYVDKRVDIGNESWEAVWDSRGVGVL